jgi:hypothetical protein
MQVIEKLESFCIALLGSFNRLRFGEPGALRLLSVGQVAFPGRMLSDAANYLYVVLVAAHFGMATCPFLLTRITKPVAQVRFASLQFLEVTFVTRMAASCAGF